MCDVRVLNVFPSSEEGTIPLFSISINGEKCKKLLTQGEVGNYIRGEMLKALIKKHEELEMNLHLILENFIHDNYEEINFNDGINIFDTDAINSALNNIQPGFV